MKAAQNGSVLRTPRLRLGATKRDVSIGVLVRVVGLALAGGVEEGR